MQILLSNDDGIVAPGLDALYAGLSDIYDLSVIAPDRNRSGTSNSLTLDRPLYPELTSSRHISINGTPADCVHLGITGLLDTLPERVISGINRGVNMGDDVI